jgi:hypothetical protein
MAALLKNGSNTIPLALTCHCFEKRPLRVPRRLDLLDDHGGTRHGVQERNQITRQSPHHDWPGTCRASGPMRHLHLGGR